MIKPENRWSKYKQRVIDYVANNPGCCKWDVAEHCTNNPMRSPSRQYYIVNTAIRNGWIRAVRQQNGRYYLIKSQGEQL